jgi:predicted glycoside hydrolase/deacetylase ChbG (UPF0249 family)
MNALLIVNADDYGRTEAINRGIRHGHAHGIVTTTTVMMNLTHAAQDLRTALAETPSLGLGVHINLTYGKPTLPAGEVPSLVAANGVFHSRDQIFAGEVSLDPVDVYREWRAQIEAFKDIAGAPDHLDSHHHMALFNRELWSQALRLAQEYGCGVRAPLPADIPSGGLEQLLPASSTEFLQTEAMSMLIESGVPAPARFFVSFFGRGANPAHLRELLQDAQPGVTELMCHPGFVDSTITETSSYSKLRAVELELLTDPELKQDLVQAGWRLSTYKEAWNHRDELA